MNKSEIIDHVEKSIENAEKLESYISTDVEISGQSGKMNCLLLNNLSTYSSINICKYLEFGSLTGSTITSASYKNKTDAIPIDLYVILMNPILNFMTPLHGYNT